MKIEIIFIADKHNEASAIIALRKMLPLLKGYGYDTLFIEMPSDEENLDKIIKYESDFFAARKKFFKTFPNKKIPKNPSRTQNEVILGLGEEKLKAWCALPVPLEYSENKVTLLQEIKKIGMKLVPIDAVDPKNTAPKERNARMLQRIVGNLKISSNKKIIIFAGTAHILSFWLRKGDPLINVRLDKDVYTRGLFNEFLKSKNLNIRKIYFFYSQKDSSYQRMQLAISECPLLNPNILREVEIKKQNFSEIEKLLPIDLKDQKVVELPETKRDKTYVIKTDEADRNSDMKLYLQDLGALIKEEDNKFIVEIESSILNKDVRKNLYLNQIWRKNLTEEENRILKQIISEIFIKQGNNETGEKGYLLTFSNAYYTTVMNIFSTKISSYFQKAIQGTLVSTSDIKTPTSSISVADKTFLSLFREHCESNFLWVAEKKSMNETGFESIKMDIYQLKEKFYFYYCENIFMPNSLTEKLNLTTTHPKFFWKQINDRLKSPLNNILHVCLIDEEVGYGVFTSDPIKAGTIIGIYAGRIEEKLGKQDEYGMDIKDLTGYRINARSIGGVTRFIQHMPFSLAPIIEAIQKADKQQYLNILFGNGVFLDKEEEDKLDKASILEQSKKVYILELKSFNEEDKVYGIPDRSYATANVKFFPLYYQGKPIIYFQACRDIEAKEQLGVSYGMKHWEVRGKSPRYFDHHGKLIPELKAKSKESVVSPVAFDYSSNRSSDLFKFIETLSHKYNNSERLASVESALRRLIKKKDSDSVIKKLLNLARKENTILDMVSQDSNGLTILKLAKKCNKEQTIKQLIIDSEIDTNNTIDQPTTTSSFSS